MYIPRSILSPRISKWLRRILALALFATAAAAPAQDSEWLEKNTWKDPPRYEGLLDQPNARREYDVLGFLTFAATPPVKVALDDPVQLNIQYCLPGPAVPGALSPEKAFIEVRQLTGHVNYLMKATQDPAQNHSGDGWKSFTWSSKDVIRPSHIDPNRLGIVIHLGQDNEYDEEIAPAYYFASIVHSAHPVDPPKAPLDRYELTLRIRQYSLRDLAYVVRPLRGAAFTCYYQNESNPCEDKPGTQSPIEAGSLVRLRFTLAQTPPGAVVLHIEGHSQDSDDTLVANFRFVHDPTCE